MANVSDKCGDSEHVSDSSTSSETSRSSSFSSEASNEYSKRAKRRKKRKHVEDWWDCPDTCDTIETKKRKKNQVTKRKIVRKKIDCLFFADNVIVVTDCPSVEGMSGEVEVMVIEDAATRKAFSLDSARGIKFPFGLCEVDGEVHFSDHVRHSIYNINFSEQSVSLALGIDDDPRHNNGPSESAKLCYPAGLAARGACLYIAEHPSEIQGAIRMASSLQGLIRFQSTWR